MDTSTLGFKIPSLDEIIELSIFQILPIIILLYAIFYAFIKRSIKKPVRAISILLVVAFLIVNIVMLAYSIWDYSVLSFLQIVQFSGEVYGVVTIIGLIPIIIYERFLRNKRDVIIFLCAFIIGTYIFLYPKTQYKIHEYSARITTKTECECLGISAIDTQNYNVFTVGRCFGVPVFCKGRKVDLCPDKAEGKKCKLFLEYD